MAERSFAVQIWTLREAFGQDMPETLKTVAEMGYQGVELCRWFDWTDMFDKWEAQAIRDVCDAHGLQVVSAHIPYYMLDEDKLESLVEFCQVVGMSFAVVAMLPKEQVATRAAVLEAAARFNRAAAFLEPAGIQIGYHNHSIDFQPIDGEMPWDILFSNTRPDVVMQMDIGNALYADADPLVYLKKFPGRSPLVHLKDYSPDTKELASIGMGSSIGMMSLKCAKHSTAPNGISSSRRMKPPRHLTAPG